MRLTPCPAPLPAPPLFFRATFLRLTFLLATVCMGSLPSSCRALNISTSVANPASFTATQLQIVEAALQVAESLWERQITGYQPGINLTHLPITVYGQSSGFASAQTTSTVTQAGFRLARSGRINVNVTILETFSDYQGTGTNFIDELMAHEIGHVLGIGTLWAANQLSTAGTGRYTGQYGVAAYQEEFNDPLGLHVPVELAGSSGTANHHWDQLMRSSIQEGNPSDPFSLDPRVGIVDGHGRDLGLELMTGAIDPDYGEPFLSRTTIQSLRDLGFTVVPEPSGTMLVALSVLMLGRSGRRNGSHSFSLRATRFR